MIKIEMTQEQVDHMVTEAFTAARAAALRYFQDQLGGRDRMCCGFAWTTIAGVKGNTKIGRMLKKAGVDQNYTRAFQLWNPSGLAVQNVDTLEAGARAAADVFRKYGFDAYAGSRLD